MVQPITTFALVAVAVLAASSVAILAWRQRPEPGAIMLAFLMVTITWWTTMYLGGLAAETLEGKLLWARLQWFGSVTFPVAWIVFALEYTGRDRYVSLKHITMLLVLPVITIVFLWTNPSHHLVRETATLVQHHGVVVLESTWGPWFFVIVGYSYLLALAGSVLFAQLAVGSPLLYRSQAIALLVGAIVPWVSHFVYLSGFVPWIGLDYTAISFTVSGIALLFALSRGKLLEATPAASRLAREFVVDGIDDGVIVVDSREHVVDLNPSAIAILDANTSTIVGEPATSVVPGYDVDGTREGDSEVAIETDDTTRYFDVRISILEDFHGRAVGRAVVLRDVTERRLHRQRLAVLHRVLRHNLRNEMTVVRGHAERLEAQGNGECARAIKDSATKVIDLSDKAGRIEKMAEGTEGSTPTVRLEPSVVAITQTLRREYPETSFVVGELPDIVCDWPVEAVVRNLAENAAEHNPNDGSRVTVEATAAADWVRVSVTDNGPGIPPVEREVLRAGSETPLRHGSGIGLWLVNWSVTTLGGSIEFAENDPTGSVVTVRMPTADARTTDESRS